METLYYVFFILLMLLFIFGNKICTHYNNPESENVERNLRIAAGLEQKTYME